MFTVDGMQWTFPCDIERISELTESEISGRMLNKSLFSDVIGTYLHYTITLVVPFGAMSTYTELYEIINEPVGHHTFLLPYNQGYITVVGKVENIKDLYRQLADGSFHWKGIQFEVRGNSPYKTHTLGDAISYGISPIPDISGAQEGDLYEYNGSAWILADFEDVDDKAF